MRISLAILLVLGMTAAAHAGMGVSFDWGPTKKCFDPKSPPMRLSGVPDGTRTLDIRMVDRNAVFNHGGGKVAYTGQKSLPYGAFRYKGPCPPDGTHYYKIIVTALDASGRKLASGSDTKPFTAK